MENKQKHNALEDAKMLADVFVKITDKEPLSENPFVERAICNYTFPSGRFFCKGKGKNANAKPLSEIYPSLEARIKTDRVSEEYSKKAEPRRIFSTVGKIRRVHLKSY